MPRTAAQILMARGFSQADIDATPIFKDPRFTAALEAEDAEKEGLTNDLRQTSEWYHTKAKPALAQMATEAANARAELARTMEGIRAGQQYGVPYGAQGQDGGQGAQGGQGSQGHQFFRQGQGGGQGQGGQGGQNFQNVYNPGGGQGQGGGQPQGGQGGQGQGSQGHQFDPSMYVDQATLQQTVSQMATAATVYSDFADDYRDLFGQRVPGGMQNLRNEYVTAVQQHTIPAGTSFRNWAEGKFNFQQKRDEITANARRKEIDDAVAAARTTWQSEQGNPNTGVLRKSNNPFAGKVLANGSVEGGKQPWDVGTDKQRSAIRVAKVVQRQLERGQAA